jgi:hypothetical protein
MMASDSKCENLIFSALDQSYFPYIASTNQYVIYETYTDTSSESMFKKIRLNEGELSKLLKDLSSITKVKIIGLYGTFNQCLLAAQ